MPEEKSITRWMPEASHREEGVTFHANMQATNDGQWVAFDDHLAALGEAGLKVAEERDRAEEERALRLRLIDAVQEDRTKERAAEQSLQTLRLALEVEVERLGRRADAEASAGERASEEGALFNAAKYFARAAAYTAAGTWLEERLANQAEVTEDPSL